MSSGEEDTFFSVDTPKAKNAVDDDDEADPYDDLPQKCKEDGEWHYNKESDEYHLKDWFRLPAQQYNSLFPH